MTKCFESGLFSIAAVFGIAALILQNTRYGLDPLVYITTTIMFFISLVLFGISFFSTKHPEFSALALLALGLFMIRHRIYFIQAIKEVRSENSKQP